jgi:hypothetical protein
MDIDANTNKILCEENIYSKIDARNWLLKNHPDKRGDRATPLDNMRFSIIKQSMNNNVFCKNDTNKSSTMRRSHNKENTQKKQKKQKTQKTQKTYKNEETKSDRKNISSCLRKRANWSNISTKHQFDKKEYNINSVIDDIALAAPKIRQMLDTIKRLDENDMANNGKKYKHFIYSDVKERGYGAKILASAFKAEGYVDMVRMRKVVGRSSNELYLKKSLAKEEEYTGFALLSSSVIYETTYTQRLKKDVLSEYNKRPDNIYGKNIRFIILDSGFKEGVDLFDVKYVHILEPSLTIADSKQTIGRATRTCGQKGLHFQEGVGWELFVYNYYLTIPEIIGDVYKLDNGLTNTEGENDGKLFKNKEKMVDVLEEFSDANPAEKKLTHQLYNLAHALSVDYDLTNAIHGGLTPTPHYNVFSDSSPSSKSSRSSKILALLGGGGSKKGRFINIKTINCNGRCGFRNTKDVPASQRFMEMIYNKYNHSATNGNVPKKNKREYLCNYMKSNSQFCEQMNSEWARQMATVPHIHSPSDVSNMELVPLLPEDKVDYNIFTDEPQIDKEKQKNALAIYDAVKDSDSNTQNTQNEYMYAPHKKMGYKEMRKHINTYFSQFKYPEMEIVNKCVDKNGNQSNPSKNVVIDYSPSQNFISHYFTPQSAYKGMLLWHSVGTGKTCSAIATSSATFEKEGYTILWVTRTTLTGDVYKNIFDMICHERIAAAVNGGETIPTTLGGRTRMISKNWIKPISYKQFSNLLSGSNEYYEELVMRNGDEDVLRKTLVIIDEAHKLYGGDLKEGEKPNMSIMERLIKQSYAKSGKDSVKLLIMTATPFTDSPMELFKLLNLMIDKEEDLLPYNIDDFESEYMNEEGIISNSGMKKLADKMAGYVSYIDRSKDASQFAQPIMIDVPVMMTHIEDPEIRNHILNKTKLNTGDHKKMATEINKQIKELKKTIKTKKTTSLKTYKDTLKKHKKECKEKYPSKNEKDAREECFKTLKEREDQAFGINDGVGDVPENEELLELQKKLEDIKNNISNTKLLSKKLKETKKQLIQELIIDKKCLEPMMS